MNIRHLAVGLLLAGGAFVFVQSAHAQRGSGNWQASPELASPYGSRSRPSAQFTPYMYGSAEDSGYRSTPNYSHDAFDETGACCDNGCGDCGPIDACDACDPWDDCCDPCGHWFAMGEVTLFRYHRADGVRVGSDFNDGENVEFDFEVSPRVSLGYAGSDGFGCRVRWWDFNHHSIAGDGESVLGVETYNIDFEMFDTVQLNSVWMVQLSGGVRWNEFSEYMFDLPEEASRTNRFRGFGGLVGAAAA